jgi:hypothetical protein
MSDGELTTSGANETNMSPTGTDGVTGNSNTNDPLSGLFGAGSMSSLMMMMVVMMMMSKMGSSEKEPSDEEEED